MNKSAIRNFAVWARNKLKADVTYAMGLVGVTAKEIAKPLPQSTADAQFFDIGTKDYVQLNGRQIEWRRGLVEALNGKRQGQKNEDAVEALVEEIAYTWFNRLIAIRFMEVNDYLPGRIRVLSSENSAKLEPDLVTNPFDGGLDFTPAEEDAIRAMQEENRTEELFRMLFFKECESLTQVLPILFGRMDEWMELVLNISFTDKDGVVYRLVHDISESNFNVEQEGQVEIVGWLYQYYNSELKDETFALLKKNVKITKERIPSATQLFTPDWIVRYMVENSLGRLWVEGHPNDELKGNWKYYLEEAKQEPEVAAQLAEIRRGYAAMTPEVIKLIDPCMGSGHILVYAFDVLMQIYLASGYTERDAVRSILENNLYGLDIDRRAAQLAYFAVMMKARQYDRRILTRGITPHVTEIIESRRNVDNAVFKQFGTCREIAYKLYQTFVNAKEYGSILTVDLTEHDLQMLKDQLQTMKMQKHQTFTDELETREAVLAIEPLMEQAEILAQKYDVVVTNPPYAAVSGLSNRVQEYVKTVYPDSKADLFAVFIERCGEMLKKNGYQAMITQHAWMFLSSFERLRAKLMQWDTINMAHLGARAFDEIGGEVVQTTSFVMRKSRNKGYKGTYARLIEPITQQGKEEMFLSGENRYVAQQDNFAKIPGMPVAYWISLKVNSIFTLKHITEQGKACIGMRTGDNDRFLRVWFEIDYTKLLLHCESSQCGIDSRKKWFPYNKGGESRKWYGNQEYVVNWENNGYEIKENTKKMYPYLGDNLGWKISNESLYFCSHITWTDLTSKGVCFRHFPVGFIFDASANAFFPNGNDDYFSILAFLNTKICNKLAHVLNPTLHFKLGNFNALPMVMGLSERQKEKACDCVAISRIDWNSFETSWDFQRHPLVQLADPRPLDETQWGKINRWVKDCYEEWERECNERFNKLKANEEELNRIFIDIYGLQDELTPDVADKDVTVRKADLGCDIRSLISYAVGCMFGRYSLDTPGLVYAGGEWDASKYKTFLPDDDNCLPIPDEDYGMEDDIVNRFVEFVRTVYGEATLEANLKFVADALGNKGATSREVIRNYFLNDFFKDHCSTYSVTGSGKRPIYWLFDSGKQNGFKALVYMHRWNADTTGNVRVEYLHRMQHVYESEIQRMTEVTEQSHDSKEIARAEKRLVKLRKQLKETQEYDARLGHLALSRIDIDLDDSVKVNYVKVQTGRDGKKLDVLGKI